MSVTEQSMELDRPLTALQIRAQVNLIQDVMKAVMQDKTHYGVIPGTQKPSLWKPGAEKLACTFRIGLNPIVEDLSIPGEEYRYRVTVNAFSQGTGAALGAGVGEASTNEEKYMWRAAVSVAEWNAAPADRRRLKYFRDGKTAQQVRTNPADLANTVLKMAKKRGMVDVILQVTAASDIFTQDVEDLPEEILNQGSGSTAAHTTPTPPTTQPTTHHTQDAGQTRTQGNPQPQTGPPHDAISEPQQKRFFAIRKSRAGAGWTVDAATQMLRDHGISESAHIPRRHYNDICDLMEKGTYADYSNRRQQ